MDEPKQFFGAIVLVILIAACCWVAFGGGVVANSVANQDTWSPRDYVADDGDCFVPPQGDPLYDAHYAQEVNRPNCDALVDQSTSKLLDAQTEKIETDTMAGVLGVYLILGVVLLVFILLGVAIFKGSQPDA